MRVAGNELDDAIIQHARKAHNLLIGERTAEAIKMEIGSAFPLEAKATMEVKGRHLTEGRPKTVTMSDEEIRKALSEPVRAIIQAVHDALERIPPELSADIFDRGIILTGGGAQLAGTAELGREVLALGGEDSPLFEARIVAAADGCAMMPGIIFHPPDATSLIGEIVRAGHQRGLSRLEICDALLRMQHTFRNLSRVKIGYAYKLEALGAPAAAEAVGA